MAIDETSTIDECKSELRANAAYDLNGSTTEARAFIYACRCLIDLCLEAGAKGDETYRDDVAKYERMMKRAESWLSGNDSTFDGDKGKGHVRGFSVSNFRGY